MSTREKLEWHFKQLDHAVGLSFKSNFHFALVGHLIKGFRHPTPTTVSRTCRVLTMLLGIIAKPMQRDKFEVSSDSVAYLTGNMFTNTYSLYSATNNLMPLSVPKTTDHSFGRRFRGSSFALPREAHAAALACRIAQHT